MSDIEHYMKRCSELSREKDALQVWVDELERLLQIYMSEGEDELSEETEYKELASIKESKRTAAQKDRLHTLALWLPDQLSSTKLRARIATLEASLAAKMAECEDELLNKVLKENADLRFGLRMKRELAKAQAEARDLRQHAEYYKEQYDKARNP